MSWHPVPFTILEPSPTSSLNPHPVSSHANPDPRNVDPKPHQVPIPEAAVGGMGAILFSLFLIYDTQRVVGGSESGNQVHHRHAQLFFSCRDVMASLSCSIAKAPRLSKGPPAPDSTVGRPSCVHPVYPWA